MELVRVDSRNPGLEEGAPGEGELARHVAALLGEIGWKALLQELGGDRANVVAVRKGTGRGRSLMMNVHLDTVGVAGMEDPFSGRRRGGKVYGRGAQDTKGGMAAVLGAAKALSEAGAELGGDLVLAFVADEEHGSVGTADLVRRVRTDAAIVLEPTDLDVCVAHRGFGVFRVRTQGKATHGGRAQLGIDANVHMGHVLVELEGLGRRWREQHRHPLLEPASLHVPVVRGGRQLFVVSDECVADVEVRTVPGQSAEDVARELEGVVAGLHERVEKLDGTVEPVLWRAPWEIDPGRRIVRAALAAAEKVRGGPAHTIGHGWWEDSALLGAAGIETVVLGPRGDGLHTNEEWVDEDSVVQLAEILCESARAYCGEG